MTLQPQLRHRYLEVNGDHPMTAEDDAYVDTYFSSLETVAAARALPGDHVREAMLARQLPLPSYLRSDGTEMVPADLLQLADVAGGLDVLPRWFRAQFPDEATGTAEWGSYLSGQYVCLWSVSPRTIQRKDSLVRAIQHLLGSPQPASSVWLTTLHGAVDDLDALEPPFTAYDRLRFGGPVSRDTMIAAVRGDYPRLAA